MANVNAFAVDPAISGARIAMVDYEVAPARSEAQVAMVSYAVDPAPGALGTTCPPWYGQVIREVPCLVRRSLVAERD